MQCSLFVYAIVSLAPKSLFFLLQNSTQRQISIRIFSLMFSTFFLSFLQNRKKQFLFLTFGLCTWYELFKKLAIFESKSGIHRGEKYRLNVTYLPYYRICPFMFSHSLLLYLFLLVFISAFLVPRVQSNLILRRVLSLSFLKFPIYSFM